MVNNWVWVRFIRWGHILPINLLHLSGHKVHPVSQVKAQTTIPYEAGLVLVGKVAS